MFCPKCGQQQSDEARFCSRCGFPLAGVGELLLAGGQLPAPAAQSGPRGMSPRRRGIRQGGGMMMIGIFLTPSMAILHELLGVSEKLPLIGVLVILAGLLRLLYALFFEEGTPRRAAATQPAYTPPQQLGAPRQDYLPPAQATPAYTYRPPAHTAEMQPPPSVTEHTTRLLDREDEAERGDS